MTTGPLDTTTIVEGLRRLAQTGVISVRVKGRCMEPVLADGETVLVARRRYYWPGDILVFRATNELRAHRLLGYRPTPSGLQAITRPDTSIDARDAPIPAHWILGRVTATAAGQTLRIPLTRRLSSVGRFLLLGARKLLRRG